MRNALIVVLASLGWVACKSEPPPPARPPPPRVEPVRLADAQQMELSVAVSAARSLADQSDQARSELVFSGSLPRLADKDCELNVSLFVSPEQQPTEPGTIARILGQTEMVLPTRSKEMKLGKTRSELDRVLQRVPRPDAPIEPPRTREQVVAEVKQQLQDFERGRDLVLVVTEIKEASPAGDGSFRGGRLAGTLLVWNRAQKRAECGAAIDGTNSDHVTVTSIRSGPFAREADPKGNLLGNLVVQNVFNALHHLKQVQR